MNQGQNAATVTRMFPREVRLTVRHGEVFVFKPGLNEVPVEHADHPYLLANGVSQYRGGQPAQAGVKGAPRPAQSLEALAEQLATLSEEELRQIGEKIEQHRLRQRTVQSPAVVTSGPVAGVDVPVAVVEPVVASEPEPAVVAAPAASEPEPAVVAAPEPAQRKQNKPDPKRR